LELLWIDPEQHNPVQLQPPPSGADRRFRRAEYSNTHAAANGR
jgi:hypothetical protein